MSQRKPPSLRTRQINRGDDTSSAADTLAPPTQKVSEKVIRDNFSMPPSDYQLIAQLQQRCLQQAVVVNKSELVRAGLKVLADMEDVELVKVVEQVEKMKVGWRS